MKQITNAKPDWVDQDLLQKWTAGGKVIFSKEDKERGCYWVVVDFHYPEDDCPPERHVMQLQRYFSLGNNNCQISCDVDANTPEQCQNFLGDVLNRII